ncbi:MAG: hypothetical protein WDZ57_02415, partial [Demequina sp.]
MIYTRSRSIGPLAAVAATVVLLSACAGTTDDPAETVEPREEVTLTLAHSGDAFPDALLAQYEEDNPHVTLVRDEREADAHNQALTDQLAAGTGGAQIWVVDS